MDVRQMPLRSIIFVVISLRFSVYHIAILMIIIIIIRRQQHFPGRGGARAQVAEGGPDLGGL
jgi:hypothetical protein